jgi:hypothetical protein
MMKILLLTTADSVQASKKIFVDTFVKHAGLAKSLTEFIDVQAEYTKKAIDAGFKTGTDIYSTMTDKAFYADTLKTMQDSAQSLFNTQRKK